MVLRRDVRVVKKRKRKEKNIVTQQVECFIPVGREGLLKMEIDGGRNRQLL